MSTNNSSNASVSTGFSWLGLLGVLLVAAKIADSMGYENVVGDWSWWLVLLPFYIGLLIFIAFLLIGGGVVGIAHLLDERDKRKYRKARARNRRY